MLLLSFVMPMPIVRILVALIFVLAKLVLLETGKLAMVRGSLLYIRDWGRGHKKSRAITRKITCHQREKHVQISLFTKFEVVSLDCNLVEGFRERGGGGTPLYKLYIKNIV